MKFHYVYGVVYAPLQVDTDWETMTQEDVKKMAHDFIAEGNTRKIDIMHNMQSTEAEVVESFIARKDDPDYPEGAWVLGVRIPEGPLWDAIKNGDLNGFSVAGWAEKVPKKVLVDVVRIAVGDTEPNLNIDKIPTHTHKFYVEFDSNGIISEGFTDSVLGHTHQIRRTTATEKSMDHSHRFFVE